mgnify:CR=1 FL=1
MRIIQSIQPKARQAAAAALALSAAIPRLALAQGDEHERHGLAADQRHGRHAAALELLAGAQVGRECLELEGDRRIGTELHGPKRTRELLDRLRTSVQSPAAPGASRMALLRCS